LVGFDGSVTALTEGGALVVFEPSKNVEIQ